jgi:transposase
MLSFGMVKQRDHELLEKRRLKAAKLFAEGKGPSEVARLLKVRRQSAHAWQQQWREGGTAGLCSKGAAGPKCKLSAEQQADVAAALLEGPEKHGHATAVWTLPRVAKLIADRTGQSYHPGHVWRVLRGLGFSCQQPTRRAIERDEAAIAHWKRVEWPRLKKRPAGKNAPSSSSTKAG